MTARVIDSNLCKRITEPLCGGHCRGFKDTSGTWITNLVWRFRNRGIASSHFQPLTKSIGRPTCPSEHLPPVSNTATNTERPPPPPSSFRKNSKRSALPVESRPPVRGECDCQLGQRLRTFVLLHPRVSTGTTRCSTTHRSPIRQFLQSDVLERTPLHRRISYRLKSPNPIVHRARPTAASNCVHTELIENVPRYVLVHSALSTYIHTGGALTRYRRAIYRDKTTVSIGVRAGYASTLLCVAEPSWRAELWRRRRSSCSRFRSRGRSGVRRKEWEEWEVCLLSVRAGKVAVVEATVVRWLLTATHGARKGGVRKAPGKSIGIGHGGAVRCEWRWVAAMDRVTD